MNSEIGLEIIEKSKQHVKFMLSNCDLAFANALRRIMISEIPTMAIELVSIYNNTSVLSDNMLAHRLGLIPLVSTDVSNYKYTHDCACKAEDKCPSCRAFFRLNARCDGESLEITTKHLEPMDPECSVKPVQLHSIHGEEVGILIAKMRKNQEIELECEARKGIGKFHAKWSPVSVANFVHEAIIKLDDRIDDWDEAKKEDFVSTCPTRVYGLAGNSKKITVERPQDCMFCNECITKAESFGESDTPSYIRITRRKDRFLFSVETTGVLTPDEIVTSALKVLSEKLKNILDNIPTDTR